MENQSIQNLFCYESSTSCDFESLNESGYLLGIFAHLCTYTAFKDHFRFFVYSSQDPDSYPDSYVKGDPSNKILIYISEEHGRYPHHLTDGYFAIFKMYLSATGQEKSKNVFPFPVGVVSTTQLKPVIDIERRRFNVFFSGNLNYNRFDLYTSLMKSKYSLSHLMLLPFSKHFIKRTWRKTFFRFFDRFDSVIDRSVIRFTSRFKGGFDALEYSEKISDSKIVLCPRGFLSSETFRLYEAMRQGCVVISEQLPTSDFYVGAPVIEVDNWANIKQQCKELLDDTVFLRERSDQTINWYKDKFSEVAVAKYIFDKVGYLVSLDEKS